MHRNHSHTPQKARRVLFGFTILFGARPHLRRKFCILKTIIGSAPQMLCFEKSNFSQNVGLSFR